MKPCLPEKLFIALCAAISVVAGTAQAAITMTDITQWDGYDQATGVAHVGNVEGTIYNAKMQQDYQWNNYWNFIYTVDAATLTEGTYSLDTVALTQVSADGYVVASSLVMGSDGIGIVSHGGWNQPATTAEVDLSNAKDITFVLSRNISGGIVSLTGYVDGNFDTASFTLPITGVNLYFGFGFVSTVSYGSTGGLSPFNNGDNTYRQVADDTIGSFDITKAGYLLGSQVTSTVLVKYYSPVTTPLEWNGKASTATWDTTSESWLDNGQTAQYVSGYGTAANFNTGEIAKKVIVSGDIKAATVNVNDDYTFTVGSDSSLTADTLNVADGKMVTMTGEGSISLNFLSGALLIEAGATVNVLTGAIQNVCITGSGTYALNSGTPALGTGTTLDENWTGTVRIGGFSSNSDTHLSSLVNGNESTVEICGITGGYLPEYSGGTVGANIKLTNPSIRSIAWIWSDGSSGGMPTITFSGDWSGDGTFRKTASYNQSFAFSGDISEWRGVFEFSSGSDYTTNLTFKGSATEVNAAISKPGAGTLNIIVGDGQSDFDTTFGNNVRASSLTVQEHATAILGGETTITDSLTLHGQLVTEGSSLSLGANATMRIGSAMSMKAIYGEEMNVSDKTVIESNRMYGTDGTAVLNNVSVNILDDYTIENMSISGSVIDISEGKHLYVKHVNIEADARITDGAARMFIEGGKAFLDESNTEASAPTMSLADVTFFRSGDTETWVTLHENVSLVSLTSELFTKVMLTGTDLWLDLTGLSAQVGDATAFSISFEDGALFDVDSLRVYATLNGEKYLDGYTTQQSGGATTLYFSAQIPEPTSSTLSLLALTALATRRRRTR